MISRQTIATVAYRLWEEAGKPEGRSEEFWIEAEKQILSPKRKVSIKKLMTGIKNRKLY